MNMSGEAIQIAELIREAAVGADGLFVMDGHTNCFRLYFILIIFKMSGLTYNISQNLLENNGNIIWVL